MRCRERSRRTDCRFPTRSRLSRSLGQWSGCPVGGPTPPAPRQWLSPRSRSPRRTAPHATVAPWTLLPTNPHSRRSNLPNPSYPRTPPAPTRSPNRHPTPPPTRPPGRRSGHTPTALTRSPPRGPLGSSESGQWKRCGDQRRAGTNQMRTTVLLGAYRRSHAPRFRRETFPQKSSVCWEFKPARDRARM